MSVSINKTWRLGEEQASGGLGNGIQRFCLDIKS